MFTNPCYSKQKCLIASMLFYLRLEFRRHTVIASADMSKTSGQSKKMHYFSENLSCHRVSQAFNIKILILT